MDYKVVEIKWDFDWNFGSESPATRDQPELASALNALAADGWGVVHLQHEMFFGSRRSIVTLSRH